MKLRGYIQAIDLQGPSKDVMITVRVDEAPRGVYDSFRVPCVGPATDLKLGDVVEIDVIPWQLIVPPPRKATHGT